MSFRISSFRPSPLWAVSLLCSASLLFALSDWEAPDEAKKTQNPEAAISQSLATGKELYLKFCRDCHGETGKGDGDLAEMLDVKPDAIDDPAIMGKMTDGEIYWKISTGKKPMPGFEKKISATGRWHLVNYVRSLAKNNP